MQSSYGTLHPAIPQCEDLGQTETSFNQLSRLPANPQFHDTLELGCQERCAALFGHHGVHGAGMGLIF